jgi:hypothetical protein
VTVRARRSTDTAIEGESVTGHGLSTNIIEASLEAYVNALEKLLAEESVQASVPAATP